MVPHFGPWFLTGMPVVPATISVSAHKKVSMADLIGDKQSLGKRRIYTLPEAENWKIKIIKEIALVKKEHLEVEFDEEDLDEILELLCQE